jgi:hypothetical protein
MTDPTTHQPASIPSRRRATMVLRPGYDPALRQESLALLRAGLRKAGLDVNRFDDLKRRGDAQIREALANLRAGANGRVPAMQDAVARSTEHWLKGHGIGGALAPSTPVYSLSTADRIDVTPGIQVRSENTAPWANSAEVVFDRSTDEVDLFDGQVTFTFSWQNPAQEGELFTVTALLGLTATCDVTADSYWVPFGSKKSELSVSATLGITVFVDGQTIFTPFQDGQIQEIAHLATYGSWGQGTIEGQDLFGTYVLQYFGLFVPSGAKVQFDLACELKWVVDDGGAQFFAAGNGRKVIGTGLFIAAEPWVITRPR